MPPLFTSPLTFFDSLRVRWWSLRLTPTSRLRHKQYHKNRRQRSTVESFQIARQYGAY